MKSFGNDEIKEQIAPLEIPNLRELISVVQACIRSINQKEAIEESDDSRIIINEAMQDITFNFSKIGQEEMKMLSDGGAELNDKVQRTVRQFTENIDHEDPEYVTIMQLRRKFFLQSVDLVKSIGKSWKGSEICYSGTI